MPDSKPAEQSAAPKTETKQTDTKQADPKTEARPSRQGDPASGVGDQARESFKARTAVPGFEGIDARLDNRAGRFRPALEQWPAKPQQVDGPDVAGQVEHTRATLRDLESDLGARQGQYSIGPHGLGSDASLREGRAVSGPDEG